MKKIKLLLVCILATSRGSCQEVTITIMGAAVFDSSKNIHTLGGFISPVIPLGKSTYDFWGFAYIQRNYVEGVIGLAKNINRFGLGLAVGFECVPEKTRWRVAATVYYQSRSKKDHLYGYIEGYPEGEGFWYMAYYNRTISQWFAIGPYIQFESGFGGRIIVMVPQTPFSFWLCGGHTGAAGGVEFFLEKKR